MMIEVDVSDTFHVIKLGGSLLDFPGLFDRLRDWLSTQALSKGLLVVGGGRTADWVRAFDQTHDLGEERGHDMAVRAMRLNAEMVYAMMALDGVMPEWVSCMADCSSPAARLMVPSRTEQEDVGCKANQTMAALGALRVVDPLAWLEGSQGRVVPKRWAFTSDSIAAAIADDLLQAGLDVRLTLLKSTLPTTECGVSCAAGLGIVDEDFEIASTSLPRIDLVNLRDAAFSSISLRDER